MKFKGAYRFYQYNGETRFRVAGVQATDVILPKTPTPRDSKVVPLALYSKSATQTMRPLHTDRGHLIGLQFGGPESSSNLVPMYGGFNSPAGAWQRQFERPLRDFLSVRGRSVNIEILVSYANKTTPVPDKFLITVKPNRGGNLSKALSIPILLNHPAPTAFYMEPDEFIARAGKWLQYRQNQMEEMCWSIELQAQSAGVLKELQIGGLNPKEIDFKNSKQKDAFYASRPYSVLDFLYFNFGKEYKMLGGPNLSGGINNVSKFTAEQVRFILQMNVVKYKGYLDSDLYGITKHEEARHLMPASTDYQAQVDHALARSGAGANAYSNARVISGRLNKALNSKQISADLAKTFRTLAGLK